MRQLLQQVIGLGGGNFDTIIFAGAGRDGALEHIRQLKARTVLLLEPDPQLADGLRKKIRPEMGEKLREVALAPTAGRQTLHRFNNSRRNSLLQPQALMNYFPNLKKTEELSVESEALKDLLIPNEFDETFPNLLILDVAGMEATILDGSDESDIQRFSHVLVASSEVVLFDGGGDAEQVTKRLEEIGFTKQQISTDTLSPDKTILFVRDDRRVAYRKIVRTNELQKDEIRLLKAELEQLSTKCRDLEKYIAEQNRLATESSETIAVLKKENQSLIDERETLDRLSEGHAAQIKVLTRARDEQARIAVERNASVQQLSVRCEELENSIARLNATVGDLQTKNSELQEAVEINNKALNMANLRVDDAGSKLDEQLRLAFHLKEQLESKEKELKETRQWLEEANIRLLEKSDAYEASIKVTEERETALRKATEELTVERSRLDKWIAELQSTVSQLEVKVKTRDDEARLRQEEVASLRKSLNTKDSVIEEFKDRIADQEVRQAMLNEELVKANAQIELIKDILLREAGI